MVHPDLTYMPSLWCWWWRGTKEMTNPALSAFMPPLLVYIRIVRTLPVCVNQSVREGAGRLSKVKEMRRRMREWQCKVNERRWKRSMHSGGRSSRGSGKSTNSIGRPRKGSGRVNTRERKIDQAKADWQCSSSRGRAWGVLQQQVEGSRVDQPTPARLRVYTPTRGELGHAFGGQSVFVAKPSCCAVLLTPTPRRGWYVWAVEQMGRS